MPPKPLDLRIVFLSTYPPKRCGIGTYTKDLANSLNNLNSERLAEIIALDDATSFDVTYPWEVSHRISKDNWEDYEKVLDYLNNSVIDMVSIQHEFGIFGGKKGDYAVRFVKKLKKPYIVTLHTVKENEDPYARKIVQELCERAHAVIVMLPVAAEILRDHYGVSPERIVAIHHGAPDFPFSDEGAAKRRLGLEDKIVMSSVNLISKWKGIEFAIQALPAVVKKYPNFLYLVVGQTHPVILQREGEAYRQSLKRLAKKLGVEKNVQFVNKYVSLEELVDYIQASDFYVTPYEGLEQISSGSLAYAIAAGKLCISTAYRYAQEMLSGGSGYLIPSADPQHISDAILHGLSHPEDAERMRRKAYATGRKMTWARVGFNHVHLIDHLVTPQQLLPTTPPRLSYVRHMTDEHGILEHSDGPKKNHAEGYATDDNARGLIVAIQYGDKKLTLRYLDFLAKAEVNGEMYVDLNPDGTWDKRSKAGPFTSPGTADWFGRAIWALSYAVRFGQTVTIRNRAAELLRRLLPQAHKATTLRTHAYILLGLANLKELEWNEMHDERAALLAQSIKAIEDGFAKHSDASWHWCEDSIRYDNARIPQALLEVSQAYHMPQWRQRGLQLLDFLIDETFDVLQNHFRFVGCHGWYPKGGVKAEYDEQPLEAGGMAQACAVAYQVTGLSYYRDMAKKALAWFHGDNILRRPLYNAKRHSVYDGIWPDGLNMNQGAENILEYLLAYRAYAKLVEEGAKTSDSPYSA